MTLISPGDCTLQCGMRLWYHHSEFTTVAVGLPYKVTRGSEVICHLMRQVAAPCNVTCGSRIMTVNSPVAAPWNVTRSSGIITLNSPGGSTLQCGRWLWDDMPLNSPKRPPYWNSTSSFDFDHITAVDVSFCTSLRSFNQIGPSSAEKKWRHIDFQDDHVLLPIGRQ